jgi:hypothetical protein
VDLRCQSRKHAELNDGYVEVRCRSKHCGHEAGVVVIHRFNPGTGELMNTNRFRDPGPNVEGGHGDAHDQHSAALRSA